MGNTRLGARSASCEKQERTYDGFRFQHFKFSQNLELKSVGLWI